MNLKTVHKPVLLKEVIEGLDFSRQDKVFLDATVGSGGHSLGVCLKHPWIKIIGLDADEGSIERSQKKLSQSKCDFQAIHSNFRHLRSALSEIGVSEIDKALFDLGFSSDQIEESTRGLSFQKDEPLIMTLDSDWKGKLTAYEIVNGWPKKDLEEILREYGEESFAGRISESIVKRRKTSPIQTTAELASVIEESVKPFVRKKTPQGRTSLRGKHPATKTFQALRIKVNDELGALENGLKEAWEVLSENGRLAVISFHSLEDRIVKNFFKEMKENKNAILITKKPITPTRKEIEDNPRSRSAKLRIIEKTKK